MVSETIDEEFLGVFVEKEWIGWRGETQGIRVSVSIFVVLGKIDVDTSGVKVVDDVVESYKIDVIFVLV